MLQLQEILFTIPSWGAHYVYKEYRWLVCRRFSEGWRLFQRSQDAHYATVGGPAKEIWRGRLVKFLDGWGVAINWRREAMACSAPRTSSHLD